MRRTVLVLAMTPLLGAGLCGPVGPTPPDVQPSCVEAPPPSRTTLLIGTNDGTFRPLTGTDELPMEYGFQGGQHVLVTLRAFSAQVGQRWDFETKLTAEGADGGFVGFAAAQACPGGWSQAKNVLVRVDQDDRTAGRIDVTARLVTMFGETLEEVTTSTTVRLLPPT